MKRLSSIMVGTAITLLTMNSCTNEVSEPMLPVQENDVFEYTFTTRGFERADESDSRTAMIMPENENENALAVWSKGDTIGIAPNTGAQAFFVIDYGAESNSATFSGGAWALKPDGDNDYAAYYPFVYDVILDRTKVPVDFTGQVYRPAVDNKLSCLSRHDFMAAKATRATSSSNVSFDFKHLGVLTEIQFAVPAAGEVTQVTLTADEKIFPVKGTFNLEAETVAITPSIDYMTSSLAIDVEGLETTTDNETVSVFFMMAPVNLSGKALNLDIACNGETETLAVSGGKDMLAGKWYTLTAGKTDEQPAYIQLESDFSVGLNDALGTLGGTKLKFVANSNTTSETIVFEDSINKVNAYAVRNGDWLEVHTVAKEFMAPESCRYAFYKHRTPVLSTLITIDFTGFNTSNVTDMSGMFDGCSALESIIFGNGFNTSKVESMFQMFSGCALLISFDLSQFDTSSVKNMGGMFSGCASLVSFDLSQFDVSSVESIGGMFSGTSLTSFDLSGISAPSLTSMSGLFEGCTSLESVVFGNFKAPQLRSIASMFAGCSSLVSIDLSGFDTSLVIDMNSLFRNCPALESVTLGGKFKTSFVEEMRDMFYNCPSIVSLDLTSFDISSVRYMECMFANCSSLKTVVLGNNFNAPQLRSIGSMFEGCSSLVSIDLSQFGTSSVISMNNLFESCVSLESITFGSKFNTSSAEDMGAMFYNCTSIVSLDLRSFDTSAARHMASMFEKCYSLSSLDLSGFTFINDVYCGYMFRGVGQECKSAPSSIYVTTEGKQYLEKQMTEINPSYAKLLVKDNKD